MRTGKHGMLMALGLLLAAAPAQAQNAPIQGTFTLIAERSDNVDQAINRATSRMNMITRPVARGRLKKTNVPYRRIAITPTSASISIATDGGAPIVTPADGKSIKWTREDGEVLDVSTAWDGNSLKQTFAAEDGQRVNLYTLSPDGDTLTMRVTVTSGRLPAPVTYQLVFTRDRA